MPRLTVMRRFIRRQAEFRFNPYEMGEYLMEYDTRKVIRNCLRQDYINKVMFLRFIKLVAGSQRVLLMKVVLPTFPERKVGRAAG